MMAKSEYSKGIKVVKIKLVKDGAIGKDRYITNPQEAVEVMCEELAARVVPLAPRIALP